MAIGSSQCGAAEGGYSLLATDGETELGSSYSSSAFSSCKGSFWKRKVIGAASSIAMCCVLVATHRNAASEAMPRDIAGAKPLVVSLAAEGHEYTKVQYLGFDLFTAPGTAADGCLGRHGESQDSCYLGNDKVRTDLLRRQNIMEEALLRVHASEHWDRSPTTLKVFLAPEFFWRGSNGAYTIDRYTGEHVRKTLTHLFNVTGHSRFKHWLICMGTVVLVEQADESYTTFTQAPWANISFYNFAPVQLGGSEQMYLEFKHFVSSIDFLQTTPDSPRQQPVVPPPEVRRAFCKDHPKAKGCTYGELPYDVLELLGLDDHEILQDSMLKVGNITVGIEICLDHKMGRLARTLGPDRSVDLQLIMSAGMTIRSGPVATVAGGPVFLSDGFARTEMSLNVYGRGREAVVAPSGDARLYNVGSVFAADSLVDIVQWLGDSMDAFTGTGFGTRNPGQGTLPGGSEGTGPTGIAFHRVSALGEDWLETLDGYYNTATYMEAQRVFEALLANEEGLEKREHRDLDAEIERPHIYPTVDIYGPIPIPFPVQPVS